MRLPADGWTAGQLALFRAVLGVALAVPGWGDPTLRAVAWLPALALAAGGIGRLRLAGAAAVVLVALFLWRLPPAQAAAPVWLLVWVLLARRRWPRMPPWPWMPPWPRLAAVAALIAFGAWMAFGDAPVNALWLLLPLAAADPAWIPPRRTPPGAAGTSPQNRDQDAPRAQTPILFFDGSCGLCHRSVRFVLDEDRRGAIRFAPLQGDTLAGTVPEEERAALPDSLVLRTPDGGLQLRSDAVLACGSLLGGFWRPLAALARLVPRPLRDAAYDAVARARRRLFPAPEGLCPAVPPEQQQRFLT